MTSRDADSPPISDGRFLAVNLTMLDGHVAADSATYHGRMKSKWAWRRGVFFASVLVASVFTSHSLANTSIPGITFPVNGPKGLVADIPGSDALKALGSAEAADSSISGSAAEEVALQAFYAKVISAVDSDGTPIVSGLLIGFPWSDLEPVKGTFNWQYIDAAFDAVIAWNLANPTQPQQFVQLAVGAGANSPQWVFDALVSCDPLFFPVAPPFTPPPGPNCGYTNIFQEYVGKNVPCDQKPLPLPWSTDYQNLWKAFVTKLSTHIQSSSYQPTTGSPVPYAAVLGSISVGGPTSLSNEIILPHGSECGPTTSLPSAPTIPNLTEEQAWNILLANASLPTSSDDAFVDAWENAIDMFGSAFSHTTLVVATGAGLPTFNISNPTTPGSLEAADCGTSASLDCAAEATIVNYLAQQSSGGFNAKVVAQLGQQPGLLGAFPLSDLSIKWLTSNTSSGLTVLTGTTTVLSQMYGGLQPTGASVVGNGPCVEGTAIPCTMEQNMYETLQHVFRATPAATDYGELATNTTPSFSNAPLNYYQVYYQDILYSQGGGPGTTCTAEEIMLGTCTYGPTSAVTIQETDSSGKTVSVSVKAKDLLSTANTELLEIGEDTVFSTPVPPKPPPPPPGCPPNCM